MRDAKSYGLQRVQIVKGWLKLDGSSDEKVFDVACAGGKSRGATIAIPIMARKWILQHAAPALKQTPAN